ncbi:MAG: glycosyltransferase family 2 protein, partial [Bacteroidales bacterium]|nr:glycosyltransferase family 2 protein [Bacteroidales bacterium]
MQTKISVIITCYNGFRYMNRCWDALEHQTYRKFKVIVVDDCSTDDTLYQLYNYQSH